MLEERLNQDLKTALLQGDRLLANTLRGLKSVILYAKVDNRTRDRAIPDTELVPILQKEAKKRQESADLYRKGGSEERVQTELAEKAIIERYLPTRLSEPELVGIVDQVVSSLGMPKLEALGQVIAQVRQRVAGAADGAEIARIAKERLQRP